MGKPTKPQWAYGDPSYRVEPSTPKKAVGWIFKEKPPRQYFNWLHYQTNAWIDYAEDKTEAVYPILLRSSGTATWNGATLTTSANLDISFRVELGEQINRIAAGAFPLADGEVIVVKRDKAGASPVVLTSAAYGSMVDGNYATVAESSLASGDQENETLVFRRSGTNLEIPMLGVSFPAGSTITFGRPYPGTHFHAASDVTSGTFADARISETSVTQHQAAFALAASQITSGTFADARIAQSNVTQHQAALTIAETQIADGSVFPRLAASETITGAYYFNLSGGLRVVSYSPPAGDGYVSGYSIAKAVGIIETDGSSNPTLTNIYNCASVSGPSSGVFTVTLDRDMASANYVVLAVVDHSNDTANNYAVNIRSRATGDFGLYVKDMNNTQETANLIILFAVFGTLS